MVLEAEIINLVEPRLSRWSTRLEEVQSMLVENIVGEPTDHTKDCELSNMKMGRTRKSPS